MSGIYCNVYTLNLIVTDYKPLEPQSPLRHPLDLVHQLTAAAPVAGCVSSTLTVQCHPPPCPPATCSTPPPYPPRLCLPSPSMKQPFTKPPSYRLSLVGFRSVKLCPPPPCSPLRPPSVRLFVCVSVLPTPSNSANSICHSVYIYKFVENRTTHPVILVILSVFQESFKKRFWRQEISRTLTKPARASPSSDLYHLRQHLQ